MKMMKKENALIGVVVFTLIVAVVNLAAIAQVGSSSLAMPFRRILAFIGLSQDSIAQHKAGVERLTQLASIPEWDKHVYDVAGNRIHWTQERIDQAESLIEGHYDRLAELGEGGWRYTYIPDDTARPSVEIVSPVEDAVIGGIVTVSVNATDNVGVVRVEFFVDDVSVGSDDTPPYEYSWDTTTLSNGEHYFIARAYDAANMGAQRRHVTVEN